MQQLEKESHKHANFSNPILFCVLAAELLLGSGIANYQYNTLCNKVAENLLDLVVCIGKKIKEE